MLSMLHLRTTLLIVLLSLVAFPGNMLARSTAPLPSGTRMGTIAAPQPAAQAQRDGTPRYDLAIDVDPAARRLTGSMSLVFTNRTAAALQDVVLRLYPNF